MDLEHDARGPDVGAHRRIDERQRAIERGVDLGLGEVREVEVARGERMLDPAQRTEDHRARVRHVDHRLEGVAQSPVDQMHPGSEEVREILLDQARDTGHERGVEVAQEIVGERPRLRGVVEGELDRPRRVPAETGQVARADVDGIAIGRDPLLELRLERLALAELSGERGPRERLFHPRLPEEEVEGMDAPPAIGHRGVRGQTGGERNRRRAEPAAEVDDLAGTGVLAAGVPEEVSLLLGSRHPQEVAGRRVGGEERVARRTARQGAPSLMDDHPAERERSLTAEKPRGSRRVTQQTHRRSLVPPAQRPSARRQLPRNSCAPSAATATSSVRPIATRGWLQSTWSEKRRS